MGEQRQEKNNLDDSAVLESITSQWWSFSSFVPLVTGTLWLWLAASSGLPALVLGLGSAASFFATGYLALGQHRCPASVPAPDTGPALAARAAVNELMMCGLILTSWPVAVGTIAVRVQREATEAYALFDEKG